MNKYIGKYRLIIINTPNKLNKDYKEAIREIEKYKKSFDILSTKIKLNLSDKFSIKLYGLDGKLKYKTTNYTSWQKFVDKIKAMPMQQSVSQLTLYADYHPKTSTKGFGFKDKKMALETIKKLKDREKKYQFLVINTMYNRAKYHPYRTKDMEEAMKVFKKWLNKK